MYVTRGTMLQQLAACQCPCRFYAQLRHILVIRGSETNPPSNDAVMEMEGTPLRAKANHEGRSWEDAVARWGGRFKTL